MTTSPIIGGLGAVYVGIDQSYSGFGITLYAPLENVTQTEVWKFDNKSYSEGVARRQAIKTKLKVYLAPYSTRIGHVAMEGYNHNATFGRELSGELGATVKDALYELLDGDAKYPTVVSINHVKQFATGKGTAQKSDMKLAVFKKWGEEFGDDNAADSYTMARMARAIHRGTFDNVYERDIIDKIVPNTESLAGIRKTAEIKRAAKEKRRKK